MASPISSELLSALDALYGAPTGGFASPPGSTGGDVEQHRRRAAERWLVAFQASDTAWQVRKDSIATTSQRDGD